MIYLVLDNFRTVMVRNLLVKMREDHYLILRAVLEICDLEIDEFMELIASNTDALASFLDHLRTSSRTESVR